MSADTDMVKLKACPFCGVTPKDAYCFGYRYGPNPSELWAIKHNCAIGHGDSEAEAITAWNTRAALDASGIGELKAQNAALCEARDALIAELSRERQVRMELQTRLLDGDRP